jgi:hypothetical protein
METPELRQCMNEDRGVTNRPSAANGAASALMMQGTAMSKKRRFGDVASDVTCETLKLALSVIRLDIAWHAGLISAESAMESVDREIGMTIGRCTLSPQSSSTEASNRPSFEGIAALRRMPSA